MSGHFGRDKTVSLLTSKVYFPGITNKVKQFVESCEACQCVKAGFKFEKHGDKLKSIHVPLETWTQLGISLITSLPVTPEGYNTMVTYIDYTSKFIEGNVLKVWPNSCMSLSTIMELPGFIYLTREGSLSYQVCVHSCVFKVNTGILFSVCPRIIHKLYFVYAQEFFL